MRTVLAVVSAAAFVAGLAGCSSSAGSADLAVGDCLRMGGPPDRPEATKAECGTPESNFKVVAVYSGSADSPDKCPSDVDSYYSTRGSFTDERSTICVDIDWVVGDCMSIDGEGGAEPVRVDCDDAAVPGRQRATQILTGVANTDQCVSGVGYAYEERNFTVCVEDVT